MLFTLPEAASNTPASPGSVLVQGEPEDNVSQKEQSSYRTGVGKLLQMMKWWRPEILNSVRELSRFVSGPNEAHVKAMKRVMKYCVATPNRGLFMNPNTVWDGDPNFERTVNGQSDSDYAKNPDTKKSITGYGTFLNGAPVTQKSRMH